MTSITAASSINYMSPLSNCRPSYSRKQTPRHYLVVSCAFLGAEDSSSSLQSNGDGASASAQFTSARSEVKDRRPELRESDQREIDHRSGHRSAWRLQAAFCQCSGKFVGGGGARLYRSSVPTAESPPPAPRPMATKWSSRCRHTSSTEIRSGATNTVRLSTFSTQFLQSLDKDFAVVLVVLILRRGGTPTPATPGAASPRLF